MPGKRLALVVAAVLGVLAVGCGGGQGEAATKANPAPSGTLTPAQEGQRVAQALGCISCHSPTGETVVGPTWKGIWGKTVTLADGSTVVVDEPYVRESIWEPNAKVVKGFSPGIMPSYRGLLSNHDIEHIIDYMKTLK